MDATIAELLAEAEKEANDNYQEYRKIANLWKKGDEEEAWDIYQKSQIRVDELRKQEVRQIRSLQY